MIAVSLFDLTGVMLEPWLEAGYECHIFDIQHKAGSFQRADGMWLHGYDLTSHPIQLLELIREGAIDFVAAFPPCNHVSISGARWFRGKGLRALQQSVSFFATSAEFCELSEARYCIENPMTTMSTYWREPDHKYHPCHYSGYVDGSEFYTKETWLWTGGGFVMPPKSMGGDLFEEPDNTYIHYQSPGEQRANIRSATPLGFARAVYEANKRSA
jgi:hypothetical protein